MTSLANMGEYIVMLVSAFASTFAMTDAEAYRYLKAHGAIKIAIDFYDVMHTQPMNDMVESMATYCRRKGGEP